jgi:DNA-binding HxlR family transcriptional regulator
MRSYRDPCGIARALDAVGERWALLIVRELCFGPRRFVELKRALSPASPNVISQRLRELQRSGVVIKNSTSYELTEWGSELHPILLRLGPWGARSPARPRGELTVEALMVALESTFVPGGFSATYDLRLGEDRFAVEVEPEAIFIARGTPARPDAIIETTPAALRSLVFARVPAPVKIRGDQKLARRMFKLFQRPRARR